ncbi:MAG: HWE histidine kinase domain-containing protein [Caulobacter sp.]|nr:HWE histidine kinase domain-containing protein [Caulobacter sp.]
MGDATAQAGREREAARLRALRSLHALDSGSDVRFDRIVRTAALLLRAPRAAIVLVDADRLWHKARVGVPAGQYPRAGSMADQMVRSAETVFVNDLSTDPRFDHLRATLSQVDVRFYAGAPLIAPGGEIVGVLSVGDTEPHAPHADAERMALEDLASLTIEMLVHDAAVIDNQRRARLDQQRVELALDAAGLGEFEWDMGEDTIFVSERMKLLTGLDWSSAPADGGEVSFRFVHPDDADSLRKAVDSSLRTEGRYSAQYRMIRPDDGRQRWMQGAGVIARDEDDLPLRLIGVVQDITESKDEEEHREVLLAELDHRVKNVLAAVQSLAAQSARKTTSTEGFLAAFAGRLKAMASAHELLTATRWRGASLAHIAAAELGGLAPGQARWEGPEITLKPRAANAASLALHELATNAVKYGALSTDSGRIEVQWRHTADGGFVIDWTEAGGPPVKPPERRGFGSTLLEQVTGRELGGAVEIDYRADGLSARIRGAAGVMLDKSPADGLAPTVEEPPSPAAGASLGQPVEEANIRGLRILIVEDAVLLALELEAGLQDAGAIIAGNAAELDEAMAMLDLEIDAAVLDANLNGASVAPLAEALKARGTPFVFATGYGERGAPEGFDAPVVRKPYNVHQIVRALAQAVGR